MTLTDGADILHSPSKLRSITSPVMKVSRRQNNNGSSSSSSSGGGVIGSKISGNKMNLDTDVKVEQISFPVPKSGTSKKVNRSSSDSSGCRSKRMGETSPASKKAQKITDHVHDIINTAANNAVHAEAVDTPVDLPSESMLLPPHAGMLCVLLAIFIFLISSIHTFSPYLFCLFISSLHI